LWSAANPWLSVGISYAGLKALGLPEDSFAKLSRSFSPRHGCARPGSSVT